MAEPFVLNCPVLNYSWGKRGRASLIARLLDLPDTDSPYAELWVGAHPKAPATLICDGQPVRLDDAVCVRAGELLGASAAARFGSELPFLFKILSIASPLSIQAHPDKERAAVLHQANPEQYPDSNHKPELAIALTPVELLYGLRPFEEVQQYRATVPEFAQLAGEGASLQAVWEHLFRVSHEALTRASAALYRRIAAHGPANREEEWILKLQPLYPAGDIGLFCFYVMNLLELAPYQGIYLAPNTPHAYLSGDLAECMANSDNVVRAGLTNKYVDSEVLLAMMPYENTALTLVDFSAAQGSFRAPTGEFQITLLKNAREIRSSDTGGVAFCCRKDAVTGALTAGRALFLPPHTVCCDGGDLVFWVSC